MSHARIIIGDCRAVLPTLAAGSVRCCVTSPPYFGLRDYGHGAQIGLEPTPDAYVRELVAVFREVWRVLADDGTLWLNLGDSYAGSGKGAWSVSDDVKDAHGVKETYRPTVNPTGATAREAAVTKGAGDDRCGLKPKDLIGIPWRVALALQADGWYLRQDIIWAKPNPMPESVRDRCTKSHEYIFMLSKSARYYYDAAAIAELGICTDPNDSIEARKRRATMGQKSAPTDMKSGVRPLKEGADKQRGHSRSGTRNKRDVWTIATAPYADAHFATFPPALIEPCILAGSAPCDTVLDPFGGSGTTASVATGHGRNAISIELNPAYGAMQERRIGPLLCGVT